MLMEGEVFLEKYRIERQIGCGGMGAVYSAVDIDLDRRVAIKVLLPEIAASSLAATRFINEGRAAARVEGDHVARVFAAGRTPKGVPYMVMEFLEGVDLEGLLRKRGRLAVWEAVDILLQALKGVAEAHRHGIVHRDLKPANLFLHRRGDGAYVVKVLDFGVSKANRPSTIAPSDDQDEPELTVTKALLGSPAYMSPEQLYDSKRVDVRTDIWSLGVIFYEMLAGVAPFEEKSLSDLVVAILHKTPPPLRELRPDIAPELERILDGCLTRDRDQRTATAAALAEQLEDFAASGLGDADTEPPPSLTEPAHTLVEPVRAMAEAAAATIVESSPSSLMPPPSSMTPSSSLVKTEVWEPKTPPSLVLQISFFFLMLAAFAVACIAVWRP
ncbi:serine/threonine protein kinase [Pendulispora rubella]|uniref:Serine/threonine protein kinase n=1 Tax=Pendulispora rubella TaxID=2741070 RepID=A0ABZ2KSV7_9BACT